MSNGKLGKEFANPFNYTGSKHRYLSEILKVLPSSENLKVLDPFVGGGDLISKLPDSWSVTASDVSTQLIKMHKAMQAGSIGVNSINTICSDYNLDKENAKGYFELRSDYNSLTKTGSHCPDLLYSLICHSNTNMMRFNKSGGFNMPFGKRTFNKNMQNKLLNYCELLNGASIEFLVNDFSDWDFLKFDLLLIDPPYAGSVATYNEQGGWAIEQEMNLYLKVDQAASNGVNFLLFGQVWANGVYNQMLDIWSKKYNVVELKNTSHQCSHNRKNDKTIEVMIHNTIGAK